MSDAVSSILPDLAWLENFLLTDVLPHWLKHSPQEDGRFRHYFDRHWRPTDVDDTNLIAQCRVLYDMAVGLRLTGRDDYRRAVERGARFVIDRYADDQYGGWFRGLDPAHEEYDRKKDIYAHAFVIFSMAHVADVTGQDRYLNVAARTWQVVKEQAVDEHGGVPWMLTMKFEPLDGPRSHNPLMHLFEALLAVGELTGADWAGAEAQGIAAMAMGKLFCPRRGLLPENYNRNWREQPPESRGYIHLGHQFEWAYLLSRAAEMGWCAQHLDQARRMCRNGLEIGYDRREGGVFSRADSEGRLLPTANKGWWEQCEAIRALLHYAVVRGEGDFAPAADKCIAFFREHFVDADCGGVFFHCQPGDEPQGTHKGTEWKTDYHTVGMCCEAIRLRKMIEGSQSGRAHRIID